MHTPRDYNHIDIKKGFTLIELLVVIVIIGLLTSIATASFLAAQKNARDNARKNQTQAIATAVETYYAAKKSFPGKSTFTLSSPGVDQWNAVYADCETVDKTTQPFTFVYYYRPTAPDCSTNNSPVGRLPTTESDKYHPDDFKPAGSWIPGLSQFLNPFPIDNRAQFPSGPYQEMFQANDTTANNTRTYVYRHLNGGYAVYTRLEGDSTDNGIITSLPSDEPKLPFTSPPGKNVYMIRK